MAAGTWGLAKPPSMRNVANGKYSDLQPFLKWAGGKRWLVERFPHFFAVKYSRYIEPFLGSGAVFFRTRPKRALLSDRNPILIETYEALRDEPDVVRQLLFRHDRQHSVEHYYRVRNQILRSRAARAAQLIYLNRTCWNGLYRVNRQGRFNVPIGTKTRVVLETDNFKEIAALLARVTLRACDFADTLNKAAHGDFVFVDPPYTVKHDNNGFVKYNEGLFSWRDQVRLRDCVQAAIGRGAHVLLTNAYHPSVRKLYKHIGDHEKVRRSSVIAASADNRRICYELVVKCFHD
jgi:DNA adenine methylase